MAGKNNPAPSPAAIASRPASAELVDSRTGEVMPMGGAADELDNLISKALSNPEALLSKVKAAEQAKAEQFSALEKDFWKPNPGDELKGLYIGSAKVNRLLQYAVAKLDKNGKPYAIRFNGGTGLTNAMKQVNIGDGILVKYLGKEATKGVGNETGVSRDMGKWEVKKLQASQL